MNTENADEYDPFVHMYPMLVDTEQGYIEIVLVFVVLKGDSSEFSLEQVKTAIPLEPGDHIDLPVENGPRFEIPDDIFSGKAEVKTNSGFWILPAIVNARRLLGPLADNIPGGDGGEPVSPEELGEIMTHINFLEVFTGFRESVIESKFVPTKLVNLIDRFIDRYRN